MAKKCRKCGGSGWWGSRFDIGFTKSKGGPCRACNGTGYDQHWGEKNCKGCSGIIEYNYDWSNVPEFCASCREDQYKSCENTHCNNTIKYKKYWSNIPKYCSCKGWYEKPCENSGCTNKIRVNCNWTTPPKYCKECSSWKSKPCITPNCPNTVSYKLVWNNPPKYCDSCKKNKGVIKDPWNDPRNKIVRWTDQDGQYNLKIVSGPDTGLHKYYDKEHLRSGEAGKDRR